MRFQYCIFLTALAITIFQDPPTSFSQGKKSAVSIDMDFPIPDKVTLCGEAMPLDDQWTWEMLDRELTITIWNKEQTFMYLKRAGRYFPYIEKTLAKNNMPDDLKYLVVAESALMPHAKST